MSSVYFISDLHLGHRTALEHTRGCPGAFRGGSTVDEHDEWVIQQCLSVRPNKRTLWWILGDVCMEASKLDLLKRLPGKKRLILGNHDKFETEDYLRYFEWVGGTVKSYGLWLSHVPMHPHELAGMLNVHGHCHRGPIRSGYGDIDPRYLNLAIDWAPNNAPVSLEYIRKRFGLHPDGTIHDTTIHDTFYVGEDFQTVSSPFHTFQ